MNLFTKDTKFIKFTSMAVKNQGSLFDKLIPNNLSMTGIVYLTEGDTLY